MLGFLSFLALAGVGAMRCRVQVQARRVPRHGGRRGAIVLLTAVLLIVIMAVLALSIDTGYMYTMQTELDRSVDAAALAGAASLVDGPQVAGDKVVEYLVRNPVGGAGGAS